MTPEGRAHVRHQLGDGQPTHSPASGDNERTRHTCLDYLLRCGPNTSGSISTPPDAAGMAPRWTEAREGELYELDN